MHTLARICTVLALPLQFGLHMALLNAPMDYMGCRGVEEPNQDCIEDWSAALPSSIYAVGGLIGSAVAPLALRRLSLESSLTLAAAVIAIGAMALQLSGHEYSAIAARLVTGIGAGAAIVGAPIAIGSFAPPHRQAFFGAMTQVSTNLGIVVVQMWGMWWASTHWRRIVTASAVLAVGVSALFGASLVSYMPRGSAVQSARKRGPSGPADAEAASDSGVLETMEVHSSDSEAGSVGVWDLLTQRRYRRLLLLSIGIFVVQQLTGINAIIQYGVRILAEVLPDHAKQVNVYISITNLGMTGVGALVINRYGRKRLLVFSLGAMGLCTALLAFAMVRGMPSITAGAALLTVSAFALGIGPIPFLYISEIAPLQAVNAAQSVGTVCSWIATFIVLAVFPVLLDALGTSSFYVFSVATLISAVGAYFLLDPDRS